MAKVIGNNNLVQNVEETDGIKWYSIDEINNINFETFDDVREWCTYIIENYENIGGKYE